MFRYETDSNRRILQIMGHEKGFHILRPLISQSNAPSSRKPRDMRVLFLLIAFSFGITLSSQVEESKDWCRLNCDVNIHKENTELIYQLIQIDSVRDEIQRYKEKKFPIRFVYVQENSTIDQAAKRQELGQVIRDLNKSFSNTGFVFYIEEVGLLETDLKLEDLSQNLYNLYSDFSNANDREDMLTVYILGHRDKYCTITATSVSCSKVGGFSYILSDLANNIVLSQFDLLDSKIVAHEFGHFFGLYHTFEQNLFGKDEFDESKCYVTGDRICDTPPDPGSVFEVYVNYSRCEMIGHQDLNNHTYEPLIENYMSYYKPCYLKAYSFTEEQELVMKLASRLSFREVLSRN